MIINFLYTSSHPQNAVKHSDLQNDWGTSMKTLLALLLITFSFNALADNSTETIHGHIDYVVCAEFDPFAVGDACVVFITDAKTNNKVGLKYYDYDWSMIYLPIDATEDIHNGKSIAITACEKIYDHNSIEVLKDFDDAYFYLDCNIEGFSLN